MSENTRAYKSRKFIDNEFTERADYNCKRYFIADKNVSTRNVNNDCKQFKCVPL